MKSHFLSSTKSSLTHSKILKRVNDSKDFSFLPEETYYAENNAYYISYLIDGNLVVINDIDGTTSWAAFPEGTESSYAGGKCVLYSSGYIVIYNSYNAPIWSSVQLRSVESKFNTKTEVKGLCQGNCGGDSGCAGDLVCFDRNTFDALPPECTGTTNTYNNVCSYSTLTSPSVEDLINISESFLRVGDDGVLEVYGENSDFSGNLGLIWTNANGLMMNDFDGSVQYIPGTDISHRLATDMYFAGDYSHPSIKLGSNEPNQGFHVDEKRLELSGTNFIAFQLASSVVVSSLSKISLTFTLGNGTDALAICLDDDITADRLNDRVLSSCLTLGGSNIYSVFYEGSVKEFEMSDEKWQIVNFDLFQLFPSRSSAITSIGIVHKANEVDTLLGNITSTIIKNIAIFEDAPTNRKMQTSNSLICPAGQIAATETPGLNQYRTTVLDFCVDSKIVLEEITRNEGEPCTSNNKCRSGLCQNNICGSRVS